MHTAENSTTNTTNSGYTNLGVLHHYLSRKDIPPNLKHILMVFGEWSLGRLRATTNTPDGYGSNRTLTQWAKLMHIGKSTLVRGIKQASELGVLKVHKGSNYRQDGGSYPDYYSIVFDKELQIKHKLFFNVSGISKEKFTTLQELEDSIPKDTTSAEAITRHRRIEKLAKEYNLK